MKAVILAAGRGSRLAPLTDDRPKGMVEVGGYPMLQWQHAALFAAGVTDVTVVTGYRPEAIRDCGYTTIHNPDWDRGNMLSSLACAFAELPGPLIVSYSDIVYSASAVKALLPNDAALALTYDVDWLSLWERRFDNPLDDAETFRIGEGGNIVEIGGRTADVHHIQGQFMGLLKLETQAREWILEELRTNPDARLAWDTTTLLSRLIAAGRPVTGIPVQGGWCEVDSHEDKLVAESLIAEGKLEPPVNDLKDMTNSRIGAGIE